MTQERDHEPDSRADKSKTPSDLPTTTPAQPEPRQKTPSAEPTTSEFVAAAATPEYAKLRHVSIRTSEGHRYCAWGPVAG